MKRHCAGVHRAFRTPLRRNQTGVPLQPSCRPAVQSVARGLYDSHCLVDHGGKRGGAGEVEPRREPPMGVQVCGSGWASRRRSEFVAAFGLGLVLGRVGMPLVLFQHLVHALAGSFPERPARGVAGLGVPEVERRDAAVVVERAQGLFLQGRGGWCYPNTPRGSEVVYPQAQL